MFLLPRLLDGVDLHYLDKTNFKGYDGQDFVTIGQYTVESRLGLLTQVKNRVIFDDARHVLVLTTLLSVQHSAVRHCGRDPRIRLDRPREQRRVAQDAHLY